MQGAKHTHNRTRWVHKLLNGWLARCPNIVGHLMTRSIKQHDDKPTSKQNQMKSSFLIREKNSQKSHRVKNTRVEHTGQDWGQALIFTYRHQRDCLTDNKRQKLVGATIPQQFTMIGAIVSGLSALAEVTKEI